jgi:hypothetical protein
MRSHIRLATAVAGFMSLGNVVASSATPASSGGLFPNIADTSHATRQLAQFFEGYFTAKSIHNANQWLQYFHPTQVVYYDATLGEGFPSRSVIETDFTAAAASWPKNATSYPLIMLGDATSAIIHYVNTPGLFGAEIRSISAIDFLDGKITRQVDFWDGRRNPVIAGRGPDDQYPTNLGLETVGENAAPQMNKTANQLSAAFAAGDAQAAAALFSSDALFEDTTLRTRLEGQLAIGRYLKRALPTLPYGVGATLRHVLGSAQGGGYEWQVAGQPTRNGITGLEIDGNCQISRLITVWDGSRTSDAAIQALAALAIEP